MRNITKIQIWEIFTIEEETLDKFRSTQIFNASYARLNSFLNKKEQFGKSREKQL